MITFKHYGNFNNSSRFLRRATEAKRMRVLDKYGQQGVKALASATPADSGLTAKSWGYEIRSSGGTYSITWTNSNIVSGVSIAIILQYGHATRNGGFVKGVDYINPAIKPIFDRMADEAWMEVVSL